jgi:predicted transcriptional regulator
MEVGAVTVSELAGALGLKVFCGGETMTQQVSGGYAGDLLSDVMAHAHENNVWLTIQTHQNIVAVAVLTGVAAIIVSGGREPDSDTLAKAEERGVAILGSDLTLYEIVGRVYEALA